jgi:hypothetical protein
LDPQKGSLLGLNRVKCVAFFLPSTVGTTPATVACAQL